MEPYIKKEIKLFEKNTGCTFFRVLDVSKVSDDSENLKEYETYEFWNPHINCESYFGLNAIISINNVYKHVDDINKIFNRNMFK